MALKPKWVCSVSLGFAAAVCAAWVRSHLRCPAVQRWQQPSVHGRRYGPLFARTLGDSAPVIVLLHGLVSTGDVFGADYERLGATNRVVVPDLLGFGRSLDEQRRTFKAEDHMDALDELLDRLGVAESPLIIGAHSMGSSLGLRWAARHPQRVQSVTCWGAPVYPDRGAIEASIGGTGFMARLVVTDTRLAEALCAWNCAHRRAAGLLAAALSPRLPIQVSRSASLHTWNAYIESLSDLVMDTEWRSLVEQVTDAGVPVRFVWGDRDTIGDVDLARSFPRSLVETIQGADHHLPITHPNLCIDQLQRPIEANRPGPDTPRG